MPRMIRSFSITRTVTLRMALIAVLAPATAAAQHPVERVEAKSVAQAAASSTHASTAPSGHATATSSSCNSMSTVGQLHSVVPETAGPGFASFIDPSVRVEAGQRVMIGCRSFIAPFASLDGSLGPIAIGDGTDIQDNVLISGRMVVLGDNVIIAHGATIVGAVSIGAPNGKPSFVGFNSYIDGATIEPDAMVTHLVKVAPGIVIHSGMKILPGKWIQTQREADDITLGKAVKITDADREFMAGVLHVNVSFAAGYSDLFHSAPSLVNGAGRDPGHSDFNHDADMPTFAGKSEAHAESNSRIIGGVAMSDSYAALMGKIGRNVSIRADEGEHFHFGIVGRLQDRVTFHALEHSDLDIGENDTFGYHVVVHGGPDDASEPHEVTRVGDDVIVKDWAVLFRSKVGKGTTIGVRAYVDGCHLAPGTIVPDRAIMIKDKLVGYVEW